MRVSAASVALIRGCFMIISTGPERGHLTARF
jgi:hypothetical protein